MTDHDIKTGKELLEEEFIQKNPDWMRELQMMVDSKQKAEIQSLTAFGFRYLSEIYLPLKIQSLDISPIVPVPRILAPAAARGRAQIVEEDEEEL